MFTHLPTYTITRNDVHWSNNWIFILALYDLGLIHGSTLGTQVF